MADETLRLKATIGSSSFEAEGRAGTVIDLYESFVDRSAGSPGAPPSGARPTDRPPTPVAEPDGESLEDLAARLPLAAFVKEFRLDNQAAQALAIAVWLKYNKGLDEVSGSDVADWWKKKTSSPAPGNIGAVMAKGVEGGHLDKEGHGKYAVPRYGEAQLEGLRGKGA